MNWEEVVGVAVAEGAIRLWRASNGWAVFYRLRQNRWEAKSAARDGGGNWIEAARPAGNDAGRSRDGWAPVLRAHHRAEPIESAAARKNRNFYLGMVQRCETCKLEKPLVGFDRRPAEERDFRTWECNDCAGERVRGVRSYTNAGRVGDYLRRTHHASRPPVESEI